MTPAERKLLESIQRTGRVQTCLLAAILLVLLGSWVFGQEPTVTAMRPDSAVAAALADAKALAAVNPAFPPRMRYVMANVASPDVTAAMGYAGSMVLNFTGDAYRPVPFKGGTMFRIDLGVYSGFNPKRLRGLLDTWDRMQDEQFYLPTDSFKKIGSHNVQVVVPAAHADVNGQLTELIALTGSAVPIISIGQFLRFGMSTLDGNLYYDFRQIERNPAKGTAEDAFLARAGITPADIADLGADQRVVLPSDVTGNWRVIEYYYSPITRAAIGPSLVTISRDWARGRIEPDEHGLENLAQEYSRGERSHDASEILIFGPDGKIEAAIFDKNGALLNGAPPNVVSDRLVPAPHPAELDGGIISCMRCHGPQDAMFKPAVNYVSGLRNIKIDGKQWDIFKSRQGQSLQRVISQFNGETKDAFAIARITHSKFAFQASGVKVETATRATAKIFDDWVYGYITPKTALLTLGYEAKDEEQAVEWFNTICPPVIEEPLRVSLMRGLMETEPGVFTPMKMTTDDWLEVYPEVALRVRVWEESRPRIQGPALPPGAKE